MVAFVIFWAAVLAVLFFILGIIFKGLASALNSLLSSIGDILVIGGLATLAVTALYLLYAIIDGIITQGIREVLGMILLFVLGIGIVGALLGGLGSVLLSIIVVITEYILLVSSFVLERAAAICEEGYNKFLTVIQNCLDKC